MRKFQLLGFALVAVCAFSALVTASVFALGFTLAEWLANGKAITVLTSAVTEGELLFENVLNGGAILCSGLFEGSVGANGEDEVTKVLILAGVEIPELDVKEDEEKGIAGTGGISCVAEKTCENGSEIWPWKLPFLTTLDLDTEEVEKFYDLVAAGAGYSILCLFLNMSINELCEKVAGTFGQVENGPTSVVLIGSSEPLGTCNGNAEDTLTSVDEALIFLLNGETLTVSL
jgi:hypothetical protein